MNAALSIMKFCVDTYKFSRLLNIKPLYFLQSLCIFAAPLWSWCYINCIIVILCVGNMPGNNLYLPKTHLLRGTFGGCCVFGM